MFRVVTSTLAGLHDPSIAIAGSRAGGLGLVDLTCCRDVGQAAALLDALACHGGTATGIALSADGIAFFEHILGILPRSCTTVVLSQADPQNLSEAVAALRAHHLAIVLECTCAADARLGAECGVDGLIAKGSEAGGLVGETASFILLQELLPFALPVWVRGGIGPHTAAAARAVGAAGVVLDTQLALVRESPLSESVRSFLRQQDGRKTRLLGDGLGATFRVLALPKNDLLHQLEEQARQLADEAPPREELRRRLFALLGEAAACGQGEEPGLLLVGQDVGLAPALAERCVTVAGVVQAILAAVAANCRQAASGNIFGAEGAMAREHGTGAAIVQGPMARISDSPEFARAVADHGGLPFMAAAWLRGAELDGLLAATAATLGDRPWGVGLLGFLPAEVFREQQSVVLRRRPPFALLAGGHPHQATALEAAAIRTYVHVPTAGLLQMFIDAGLRRFIFEGREAGGHVGPFFGFVLWEEMIECLLAHGEKTGSLNGFSLLFAGGIHDGCSAAMIAAMTAGLTGFGAAVGLQLGSAYLFTREAVGCGAIVAGYQEEMLKCRATTLLETGPGHAVRCTPTPFVDRFHAERQRLQQQKVAPDEMRRILEEMERGRLRIAAKGVCRASGNGAARRLVTLAAADQQEEGIFMVGQVAALRQRPTTIAELHQELVHGGFHRLTEIVPTLSPRARPRHQAPPSDIAIVGMAGFFPGAGDIGQYWSNIVAKVNCIREIPADRWDWRTLFAADRQARDRIYSKWGTFLDDIVFDPLRYAMPPKMLPAVEPLHLMALEAVRHALADAGYDRRPFDRERTSVSMGISGSGDLAQLYGFRTMLPLFFGERGDEIIRHFSGILPEWTEDSFPGILMNVAAGRIANRFDFGGMNTLIDGACASSLAALYSAVRELETGACDLAVAGGADCMQNPFTYMCFSKTHALSPRGVCNCLDARADGIVIGESVVITVLKRLADAERDGDRIYAVIKGMGASSDGRDRSLTAPAIKGQLRALHRAYDKAGVSPAEVGLFEAHATGTVEGDKIEVESLTRLLREAGATARASAIGSVKSMIGHSKSAAGLASLVKTALALHHRVLPPTHGVETPNPGLQTAQSPLYPNNATRPWLNADRPRRAGVSAFGFGGTNYHVVLEEYQDYRPARPASSFQDLPTELFVFAAADRAGLLRAAADCAALAGAEGVRLRDLSWTNHLAGRDSNKPAAMRLAIVADSAADLMAKIETASAALTTGAESISDPRGIFFREQFLAAAGTVAFLFPGQGSQYVDMLAEAAVQFPWMAEMFGRSDRLLADRLPAPLSSFIYPPSVYSEQEEKEQGRALSRTTVAQPAMGTADLAMLHLLDRLGVRPEMAGGHSYGEYVALCAAGVIDEEGLILLSEARARCILEAAPEDPGTMAAVEGAVSRVEEELSSMNEVWVANVNAPDQVVITGKTAAVEEAVARFDRAGIRARRIAVSCAFHSPLMQPACATLTAHLAALALQAPALPVYSNVSGAPYPEDGSAIRDSLTSHLVSRVRFVEQIERMYADGARIFVECGPGRVLSGLVGKILADRPHAAVITCQRGRNTFTQLHFALAELIACGVAVDRELLFAGRQVAKVDGTAQKLPASAWLVNGSRVRPAASDPGSGRIAPYVFAGRAEGDTLPEGFAVAAQPQASPADATMLGFQRLMRKFLDTQQEVMGRYLGAAGRKEQRPVTAESSPLPAVEISDSAGSPAKNIDASSSLLAIAAERTGYPVEMLDLDSDMEADLGIDSIKRVEILGSFLRTLDREILEEPQRVEMEKARTLRRIITVVESLPERAGSPTTVAKPEEQPPKPGGKEASAAAVLPLPRCLVVAETLPLPASVIPFAEGHCLVVTGDSGGIAEELADRCAGQGIPVVVLRAGSSEQKAGWHAYPLPADEEQALALADRIRAAHGPVGGFVHLSSLGKNEPFADMATATWHRRLADEFLPLFFLLQTFAGDLRSAGNGVVATVSAMGGRFGLEDADRSDFFPGQGALAGFVKTLALEWPEVRCRAIDLALAEGRPQEMAAILHGELFAAGDRVEIGRDGDRRFGVGGRVAILADGQGGETLQPDCSWVAVITGGARGITARVALELARRFQLTLILAGRSPLPVEEEIATASLAGANEIRKALIAKAHGEGRQVTVAEVEDSCKRLLAGREIRTAIRAMEAAGSRVIYEQLDVSDGDRFAALLADVHRRHGRLDLIVHGAGIIEDKLFVDKGWESFARVFFTKADSAFTLAHLPEGVDPACIVFFASVAGTFGNRGQCDYAAANEVMNKLALWLQHRCRGRMLAVNWGPWAGSGMASAEVQQQFVNRGVGLVDQDAGAAAFIRELQHGRRGEVEILLGDGPWVGAAIRAAQPMLRDCPLPIYSGEGQLLSLTLAPGRHRYLVDHCLDGKPVLPAAAAVEIMAEAAAGCAPGLTLQSVREVRVLKGIVIDGAGKEVRVTVQGVDPTDAGTSLSLRLSIREPGGGRLFYSGRALFGDGRPAVPAVPELPDLEPLPVPIAAAYGQWLFHGPLFQCITHIEGINAMGMRARMTASEPAACLRDAAGSWLLDPVLVDGGLQLALLWARHQQGLTVLPSAIAAVHLYDAIAPGASYTCQLQVVEVVRQGSIVFNMYFSDDKGRVAAMIDRVEATGSRELNRLVGQVRPPGDERR
ncbi:MAG: SDR family NAD(P)-dependent oxidoreductase [Thermodesulfobacteriota bacterium]